MSNLKTIVAIAYDFDGTLAPGYMQEYDFIPNIKIANEDFWEKSDRQAAEHDMDGVLSYMLLMLKKAKENNISIKEENFINYGKSIQFFEGVEGFFDRINKYAATKNILLEHHIISSGLREFVKGTTIAKHFKNIFASGFTYDEQGAACWPALVVNYTNKTQFLFRINKGINNAYDNSLINKRIPEEQKVVPFENIIYIGDGETDVPAMKMVKLQGGTAIAVYNPHVKKSKNGELTPREVCKGLIENDRADYLAPANYSENQELDIILKKIIDKISSEIELQELKEAIMKR
ncbi:MAG TPA: HAD family hydrolase [Bacteroidales bacterium]|jgi:hydroxymethylpyrimidine pyrophosphatase-like HAD family hydrolase|nr:HAD family hydrolase [Bacteroidales bacterium]HOS57314.1 HAD family hydrolase [Bacteroidales bacterium]HPY80878.1 HAD family hydrolase [Bacteroidales bacterium]HQA86097.1 HAD family hydrolase [Bacteroidales bacterium]